MPNEKKLFEEWPEDKPMAPPEPSLIFRPHKELDTFWPDDQPQRTDELVRPYETKYLVPLGRKVAEVFAVPLIDDLQYCSVPEEDKAAQLFCCLTRSGLRQEQPGIWRWNPIVVVIKYCLFVKIRCEIDVSNNNIRVLDADLWSEKLKEHVPIIDHQKGYIQNPSVLIPILHAYADKEELKG